jgi:hypothetical protein
MGKKTRESAMGLVESKEESSSSSDSEEVVIQHKEVDIVEIESRGKKEGQLEEKKVGYFKLYSYATG